MNYIYYDNLVSFDSNFVSVIEKFALSFADKLHIYKFINWVHETLGNSSIVRYHDLYLMRTYIYIYWIQYWS